VTIAVLLPPGPAKALLLSPLTSALLSVPMAMALLASPATAAVLFLGPLAVAMLCRKVE
jgi:hypothetical protein